MHAMKKENYLQKCLNSEQISKIISQILSTETWSSKIEEKPENLQVASQEISTAFCTNPNYGTPQKLGNLVRTQTIEQFIIFPSEEDGPKFLQTTRATMTENMETTSKKDVFFIYEEENLDEKYREKIDYKDPIILKGKNKNEVNIEENKQIFDFGIYKHKIEENFYKPMYFSGFTKNERILKSRIEINGRELPIPKELLNKKYVGKSYEEL